MSDKAILLLVVGICVIGIAVGGVAVVANSSAAAVNAVVVAQTAQAPAVSPSAPGEASGETPAAAFDPATEGLRELERELRTAGLSTLGYAMYDGRNARYAFRSSEDAVRQLDAIREKVQADAPTAALLKYADNVATLLKSLEFTPRSKSRFMSDAGFPVTVARHEGRAVVLMRGVYADVEFNSLRTDERARAAHAAVEHVLPTCGDFLDAFHGTDVERYAVAVTYGARDFSEQYTPARGEMLAVVFDRAAAQQYRDAAITAQQFLDRSTCYLDAGTGELKNVTLKLE